MQLAGSLRGNEGEVQLYHNSSWKKVCRDLWTFREANVVCHELGYLKAVSLKGMNVQHLNATHPFLKVTIKCSGRENKLSECIHKEKKRMFCNGGAAEVTCAGNEGGIKSLLLHIIICQSSKFPFSCISVFNWWRAYHVRLKK